MKYVARAEATDDTPSVKEGKCIKVNGETKVLYSRRFEAHLESTTKEAAQEEMEKIFSGSIGIELRLSMPYKEAEKIISNTIEWIFTHSSEIISYDIHEAIGVGREEWKEKLEEAKKVLDL